MLEGLLVFHLLAAAGIAGEMLLIDRLRITPLNDWLADHLYLPALRMPALIGFVLGAYPALFGLDSAPPLGTLLDFDWFGQALNLLFVLPLVFSLLPVAGRVTALVLPLQGMALTAMLFTPLAVTFAAERPSLWPDASVWLALLGFGIGGHLLGTYLAERLPRQRRALPAYDAIVLVCQAPAILAYGALLGSHLQGT